MLNNYFKIFALLTPSFLTIGLLKLVNDKGDKNNRNINYENFIYCYSSV